MKNRAVLLSTLGVACFIAADVGIGFLSVRLIDNPLVDPHHHGLLRLPHRRYIDRRVGAG